MFHRMRRRIGWITLATFLVSAGLGVVVERSYAGVKLREQREHAREALSPYANALAAAVGRRVAQISGLRAFVESRRDFATLEREFKSFSEGLLGSGGSLRAVELVRGDRIALISPMAGNEAAMGLNLRTDPREQARVDFMRAAGTDSIVLSGPVMLRQGTSGLIIRQRAHTKFAGTSEQVALVLEMRVLLAEVGISSAPAGLGMRLYDRSKRLVDSTHDSLPRDPERITVDIRDGN